jgi:hypothetical protein
MPTVRRVLAWKIPFSILFLLPLVFLPLSAFPDLQIPEYDKVAMVFIRLLGAALVALVITQLWGVIDSRALRGAVISAIAETALVAMAIWHFVFYGYLQSWPMVGKAILLGMGTLSALFAVLLLVTGIGSLFGDDEPVATKPAPTGGTSSEPERLWPSQH